MSFHSFAVRSPAPSAAAALVCTAIALGTTSTAAQQAEPPLQNSYASSDPASPDPASNQRTWYGWQTLAVDATTLTLFDVAALTEQDTVAGVGAVGFVLGSPTIHLAHGNAGPAIVSVGGHLLIPLAGFLVARVAVAGSEIDDRTRTVIGVSVGAAGAAALDAIWLAWVEPVAYDVEYTSWRVAPWVDGKGAGVVVQRLNW